MQPIRVLIAKPGLDGHDRGAKVVARALRDAGMEVIYTGLFQSVAAIVKTAIEDDVDVIGLSILSGTHVPLTRDLMQTLQESGVVDKMVVVGGSIPPRDIPLLTEMGVRKVFPVGTPLQDIVESLQREVLDKH
jgi:methylmalonyl-CoA mutase C-terminal domain/subunit